MVVINDGNWPWRPFQQDGKYGYIDRLENIRIEPVWDDVLNSRTLSPLDYFSNNMILPVKQGPRWGAVNSDNKLVIPPEWEQMSTFLQCDNGQQFANVMIGRQKALIDEHGKVVMNSMDDADFILPNGFVIFSRTSGQKTRCGIRTLGGTDIIPCKYTIIHFCPTNLRKVTLSNVDCDESCWDIHRIQLFSDYPNPEVFRTDTGKKVVISIK
jgi:hypothetical protein